MVSDCIEYALLHIDIICLSAISVLGLEYCPHTYCCFLIRKRGKSEKWKRKNEREYSKFILQFLGQKETEKELASATSSTLKGPGNTFFRPITIQLSQMCRKESRSSKT